MSQADDLPKFFKDEAGFCYVATALLARLPGMTPWNGAVDANGMACETAPAAPVASTSPAAPVAQGLPLPVRPRRQKGAATAEE